MTKYFRIISLKLDFSCQNNRKKADLISIKKQKHFLKSKYACVVDNIFIDTV